MSDYFCHIHGDLDDYGLSPIQFRLYCHIARRGDCWESVKNMAEHCGISEPMVRLGLQYLTALRLLNREDRPGASCVYSIAPRSDWRPGRNPSKKEGEVESSGGQESDTGDSKNPIPHPSKKLGDKVYPIKCIQEVTPKDAVALSIYDAYPRKVAKPAALRAIGKALKGVDAPKLLELTQAYAKAVEGTDPQYIPHPATWFNQERFKDDPATWRRSEPGNAASLKPAPVQTILQAL